MISHGDKPETAAAAGAQAQQLRLKDLFIFYLQEAEVNKRPPL